MRFRKLRIAFSAVCGIVCVLLIALWMRSYWHVTNPMISGDDLKYLDPQKRLWQMASWEGAILLTVTNRDPPLMFPSNPPRPRGWTTYAADSQLMGFGFMQKGGSSSARLPVWFPLVLCATLAAAPWVYQFRWRFSLRTLLIATTLIAGVLGLIACASRHI
jgi:hypothetical protein